MTDTDEPCPDRDYTLLGGRLKAALRVLTLLTDKLSNPAIHYDTACEISWVVERLTIDASEIADAFDKLART